MSKREKWVASALAVALLTLAVWGVRKEKHEPAGASDPIEGAAPPAAVEEPLAEPLPGSEAAQQDRVPAGPAATVVEPTRARVIVLVVAKGSGVPVPGVAVSARSLQESPALNRAVTTTDTDADGRVELEVDEGVRLLVSANGMLRGHSERDEPVGYASVTLEPLLGGERREVTLEVPIGRDLVFFGRVVNEITGAPIPGARAVNPFSEYQVDADGTGLLELHVPSWRPGSFELTAEGYGLRRFVPAVGHEQVDDARRLPLLPVATLRVQVRDEGPDPLDTLIVRLSAKGYELDMPDESLTLTAMSFVGASGKSWKANCGADGTCELVDLPARVPLEAELWRGREVVLRAGSFGLEPGEVREIEWKLNSGARVVGVVIDQHGNPVPRCALARLPSSAGPGPEATRWLLMEYMYDQAAASTASDAEGRFAFEDVAPGTWWIGPRPPKGDTNEVAALAVRVEVPPGVLEHQVELRVERGLFVRGRVLTPDGSVPENAFLSATGESMNGRANGRMQSDGSFQLGPLPGGSYRLQARAFRDYAKSLEVVAHAGDEDILLQLRWAGTIAGGAFGARDGTGRLAELTICGTSDGGVRSMTSTKQDGSFEIGGLEAGEYDLTAASPDGLIALLRGVAVTPGATNAGLRFELRPGASVEVRYEGVQDYGHYEIRSEGAVVVIHSLKRGATAVHTVPPGAIEVELRHAGSPVETHRLELGTGEKGTVVFEP